MDWSALHNNICLSDEKVKSFYKNAIWLEIKIPYVPQKSENITKSINEKYLRILSDVFIT